MPNLKPQLRSVLPAAVHTAVELVLKIFAFYLIPLGIGLVSLVALLFWHDAYRTSGDVPLAMHVTVDESASLSPAAALDSARARPLTNGHDTHLSEAPVWFLFEPMPRSGEQIVEFPSRHALDIACWDGATLGALGSATRSEERGVLRAEKAGSRCAWRRCRASCCAAPASRARHGCRCCNGRPSNLLYRSSSTTVNRACSTAA